MLVGLATEAALVASCLAVFLFGQLLHHMGLAILIFLALALVAAVGYAVSLPRLDRFARNRRESLIEELCHSEGAT
jgi:NADH:ubiquinone oxidoreductase subunit K